VPLAIQRFAVDVNEKICGHNLLFRCASATVLEVAANPKRFGVRIAQVAFW
jgi:hypothetical protein